LKKLLLLFAAIFFLIVAKAWHDTHKDDNAPEHVSFRPVPGKTFRIDVPDIFGTESQKRIFEMRIPDNYRADEPVPLLVWFSPGGGSESVNSIPPIVDFRKFLVVALPYPAHKLPRLAIKAGAETIDRFWDYERLMLEYVVDHVPNVSTKVRVAAGFSSGAHLIGSGLDRDWVGFADFFTAYVLHEGGYAPAMTYRGIKDEHKVLVTYGLKNNSYGRVVVREMKRAHKKPDVIKLPHTGHSMSQEAIDAIREWIETHVG
jgi:hypothetical protein